MGMWGPIGVNGNKCNVGDGHDQGVGKQRQKVINYSKTVVACYLAYHCRLAIILYVCSNVSYRTPVLQKIFWYVKRWVFMFSHDKNFLRTILYVVTYIYHRPVHHRKPSSISTQYQLLPSTAPPLLGSILACNIIDFHPQAQLLSNKFDCKILNTPTRKISNTKHISLMIRLKQKHNTECQAKSQYIRLLPVSKHILIVYLWFL